MVALVSSVSASEIQTVEFARGVVIEKVISRTDPEHTYALYLPQSYSQDRKWPIVYVFDPFARGSVPVKLFKEAADKFGFIIVGSNNSRNGMSGQTFQTAITTLLKDTNSRLSIDAKRVYVSGLSGGARVAVRVASSCTGCVAGVIACGAGFPNDVKPTNKNPFAFYATVGTEDFNYPELRRLDDTLESLGIPHRTRIFDGDHDWASPQLLTDAIEWMEVQAMREGRRELDSALIEALWSKEIALVREAEASDSAFESYVAYSMIAADFARLKDVKEYESKALALKESKDVKQAIKAERARLQLQIETSTRIISLSSRLLTDPLDRPNLMSEIRSLVRDLRKTATAKEDSADRRVARRILSQVSAETFEAAMYTYIPSQNYAVAGVNLEIAEEVTPDYPRIPFVLARVYALTGEKKKAIEALRRAVAKGFKNAGAIESEKDFASLRGEEEYKAIIDGLKAK